MGFPIIDVSLATRLIVDQFPEWADLPIRPVAHSGHDNRTFHLGSGMSLRLPSAAGYALQVEKEQRWLPHLAPRLPLDIPVPLAMGTPTEYYPCCWSVYRWLPGADARINPVVDTENAAKTLGEFLTALQRIPAEGGPPPGKHNFFRGASPAVYNEQTRAAIAAAADRIDAAVATEIWEAALGAPWAGSPVWLHGDFNDSNFLVSSGKVSAVIDFGCMAVGDPACDLMFAWSIFSGTSRETFREAVRADAATWTRARGWALWKGLITIADNPKTSSFEAGGAETSVAEILADSIGAQ